MRKADLSFSSFNLTQARFVGFSDAILFGTNIIGTDIWGAKFIHSHLEGASFQNCSGMEHAVFENIFTDENTKMQGSR